MRTVNCFVVHANSDAPPASKLFEVLVRERIAAQASTTTVTVTDPQYLSCFRFQPTSLSLTAAPQQQQQQQQQQANVDHATTGCSSSQTSDNDISACCCDNDVGCVVLHSEGSVMMKDGCAKSEGSVVVAIVPDGEGVPSRTVEYNFEDLKHKAARLGSAPLILLRFSSDKAAPDRNAWPPFVRALLMNADKLIRFSNDNPAGSLKISPRFTITSSRAQNECGRIISH
ncbi:hypothetical protein Pelo_1881 [Pelomyxa schiedti]|nr:hypothetical protein Pelo_1881 [Pelomyxa schiedti]